MAHVLTILMIALFTGPRGAPASRPATLPSSYRVYPTFGLAFEPPARWRTVPETAPGEAARLVLTDETNREVLGIVTITLTPIARQTLAKYAQDLAKQLAGTVMDTRITLDGVEGVVVQFPAVPGKLYTERAIIAEKGAYFCVIARGEGQAQPIAVDFDALLKSWKWIPIEPAVRRLEFRKSAMPIFNLLFINVPVTMRPYVVRDAATEMRLGLQDYRTGRTEFTLNVKLVPLEAGTTFDAARDTLAKAAAKQLNIKEPLAWSARQARPAGAISNIADAQPPGLAAGEGARVRLAVLQADTDKLALIVFTITPGNGDDRKTYEALSDRILDSISSAAPQRPVTTRGSR